MKIWYCAFTSLVFLIVFWLFAYGFLKSVDHIKNSSIEVKIVTEINEEVQKNESYGEVFRNKKVRHHVPKFMLELYEKSKMVKKENLKIGPDIVRSIVPAYGGTHHSNLLESDINNDHHLLLFKVPNSSKDEIFLRAELQILTLIEIKSTLTLGIEREIKISLYNETTNELKILEEKHIYHTDNTWISFNVSHAVQSAILSNHKVLKLVISVKLYQPFINNQSGVLKLSLMPIEDNFEHDYPVLLLFYSSEKFETGKEKIENLNEEKEVIRKRRYADEDYEEETNKIWDEEGSKMNKKLRRMRNNCRRRPLYVDFAEIGYDSWIVQPNGYEAYQCAGKCFYPVAEHLSPTKHAIVQALLHSVSPSRAPRSCCVPTKLDSISVLYVDAHGVLTYRYAYKDMVVTDCGCR